MNDPKKPGPKPPDSAGSSPVVTAAGTVGTSGAVGGVLPSQGRHPWNGGKPGVRVGNGTSTSN